MFPFKLTLSALLILFCFTSLVSSAILIKGTKAQKCWPIDRKAEACTMDYTPVCGYKPHIRCIKAPCNYITYSNACAACLDSDVKAYVPGECPEDLKVSLR